MPSMQCPECDAPVESGQLTCRACCALLAAVRGGPDPRRALPAASVAVAAEDPAADSTEPDEDWLARVRRVAVTEALDVEAAPVAVPAVAEGAAARTDDPDDRAIAVPAAWRVANPWTTQGPAAAEPTPIELAATEPAPGDPPPSVPAAAGRALTDAALSRAARTDAARMGATASPVVAMPRLTPARIAGAWLPPHTAAVARAGVARSGGSAGTVAPAAPPLASPSLEALRRSIEALDLPTDLAGRLVTSGAVLAAFGFLLPWLGTRDYFSSWGFASVGNLPIFLLALATAAVAVVATDVPRWLRLGVSGILLGGLLVGLLIGRGALGLALGSVVIVAASAMLFAGGALAVHPDRTHHPS
jgi:hypothetical protein